MSDGMLGADVTHTRGGGRWQPLSEDEEYSHKISMRPTRSQRPDEEFEAIGPPLGVSAAVQGDIVLRALIPAPLRATIALWPYVTGIVLVANVLIVIVLHRIWGDGNAFKMNVIDPANAAFCAKPYDLYRSGDVSILVPLLALPEALRLRRFCLHATDGTFSAPLADLYSSISLFTPQSWQATLAVSASRCALGIACSVCAFVMLVVPAMLSSSMLHYPARLARIAPYTDACGSDWWFGQVPDIFLVALDLPVVSLVFVPYFVVLHAAEGVRLALHAYTDEFEMRLSPVQRDETTVSETVRKHQALELLLEHATAVLEPALRWLLLVGLGMVLALITWSWMEFTLAHSAHSLALFAVAMAVTLALLPLLRAAERINAFQARLEKLAFSVGDPDVLGAALPASISQAAMLREYMREHSLSLRIGGLVIRPSSALSSTTLLSLFALMMVPYCVLIMPQLFGDPHLNDFKREMLHEDHPHNGTKPLCVFCGHCAFHGWCQSGLFSKPGYEDCRPASTCTHVTYAAEIAASSLLASAHPRAALF